ncbi:MAG: flagellar basal-body rod protein FlgF [Rhodospirillales bacterium]|nr:flagellar basal-body rod protein FlgF [Alphaproteobacteria bacterium]USO02963.1 MAG: flagellar basal-body rod protein FlgF [Rhodospirillales bacterium]
MENSLYIGLSSQVALHEKMSIIANNVANLNTPGFRAQNMVFDEYVHDAARIDTRNMKENISMVLDYGQYQMTDPGPVKVTGNALDAALIGPGFFGIQTPEGVQYTRAGNFSMAPDGTIVNARGLPVASQGGGNLTVPTDAKNIYIDHKGVVSTDNGQVGALMVVEFENEQKLDPAGNGLYKTDEAGTPAQKTTVHQGKLEGSNVESVVEMTRMIDVLREYQAVQNMMRNEHERLRTAIQRLSKTNG